jgi:hypothetical protein
MNRVVTALMITAAFALSACAVETEEEAQPALSEEEQELEVTSLEIWTEAKVSRKEDLPSVSASCNSWGSWASNGSRWCGGTGLGCLFQGSVGIYTRESRSRTCCAPPKCWTESEYRDTLLQCGC